MLNLEARNKCKYYEYINAEGRYYDSAVSHLPNTQRSVTRLSSHTSVTSPCDYDTGVESRGPTWAVSSRIEPSITLISDVILTKDAVVASASVVPVR